ncbi:outer membrane protein assembly factor BamB family protein [Halalkalicoccus subterraneus]|uniref:outer membrane protein assembly factor BamB family protein n=1 Tax=Halalkalicoccus subterraneus TaxID=2675002 RepID=UPI000EFCE5C6|nr:PQQ-binding-like beta-propeller repeat protein [Halalkalicoccus subterraneus]
MQLLTDSSVPCATHMYDKLRTGQAKNSIKDSCSPELAWKTRLPNFPAKAPESTPVFDSSGNIYFGCHDGNLYSLSPSGDVRWSFMTNKKIFGGPLITDSNSIIVASGNGYLHSITTDGTHEWAYDISEEYRSKKEWAKSFFSILPGSIDYSKHSLRRILCWSSPNIDSEGNLYITGFGEGIHSVDAATGEQNWSYDLGVPRFHTGGAAIDKSDNIYVPSQRGVLYCFDTAGNVIWKYKIKKSHDTWAAPSIDLQNGYIYQTSSFLSQKGQISAISQNGELIWETTIDEGIRGTASISHQDYVVICGLNGTVYFIGKEQGRIYRKINLSNAPRAMWTSASIDRSGNILIGIKESFHQGSLVCIQSNGRIKWSENIGKAYATPIIGTEGEIYIGSWKGEFYCYTT